MNKDTMMNRYIMRLYTEFRFATHRCEDNYFEKWLKTKENNIKLYYNFLNELGLDKDKPIIELSKGYLDTIALATKQPIIEISEDANTIKQPNVEKIEGSLDIKEGNPYISGLEINKRFDLRKQQYSIQYPFDEKSIRISRYLAMIGESIYVGAYGSSKDYNKEAIIRKLKMLQKDLELCGIDSELIRDTIDDKYMCIVKNKVKSKI